MATRSDTAFTIGYAPSLLPDELLYSWLGRLVALNALGSHRQCLQQLFGSRDIVPSADLPTRIESLRHCLGASSPFDCPDRLIEASTVYAYHRPFLPPQRHEKIRQILLYGGGKGLKTLMGRVANGFGARPPLQRCVACTEEDVSEHGSPFWHRAHQLPGVTCCTRHRLSLQAGGTHSLSMQKTRFILAPGSTPNSSPAIAGDQQLRFALLSQELLLAQLPAQDHDVRRAVYLRAIAGQGLLDSKGRVDYDAMCARLRQHYEDFEDFPHHQRLLAPTSHPLGWLRDLIECRPRALHPICHLLLIGWGFGSVDSFSQAMRALGNDPQRNREPSLHSRSVPVPDISPSCAELLLRDPSRSCRAVAEVLHLCVTTVATRRRAMGIPISERRKTLDPCRLTAIEADLLLGAHPACIAKRHGVSLSTVYRVRTQCAADLRDHTDGNQLLERDVRRQRWLRLLAAAADVGSVSISAARNADPAAYAWLYRNDRPWLQRTNAPLRGPASVSRRVDWGAREKKLCLQLEQHVDLLRSYTNRGRISKTKLLSHLGDAMVRANLDKMPRLHLALEAKTETQAMFRRYRIDRAIYQLIQQGKPLQAWRILRAAGIQKWTTELYLHARTQALRAMYNEMSTTR